MDLEAMECVLDLYNLPQLLKNWQLNPLALDGIPPFFSGSKTKVR